MSLGERLLIEALLVVVLLWRFPQLVRWYGSKFRWKCDNPHRPLLGPRARRALSYLPPRAQGAFRGKAARLRARKAMTRLWLVRPALAATVWADRNPVFAAVLVLLWLLIFGVLGRDFGIQDLFWHEKPVTQILAGVNVGSLVYLVIFLSELSRKGGGLREVAARFHVALAVPAAVVAAQAVVWIASEVSVVPRSAVPPGD